MSVICSIVYPCGVGAGCSRCTCYFFLLFFLRPFPFFFALRFPTTFFWNNWFRSFILKGFVKRCITRNTQQQQQQQYWCHHRNVFKICSRRWRDCTGISKLPNNSEREFNTETNIDDVVVQWGFRTMRSHFTRTGSFILNLKKCYVNFLLQVLY